MTVPFLMSELPTSPGTPNVIFSPALADGASRYAKPLGEMIVRFGLAAVLASLSPSRAKEAGLLTIVTSGPTGDTSSRSANLQRYLESRLRPRLNGSDLCEVIWKPWATPWGQSLSKPRARVRTISGIGIGLLAKQWATPQARDGTPRGNQAKRFLNPKRSNDLPDEVMLVSPWPTPTQRDHKDGEFCPNVPVNGLLGRMVWPTPTSSSKATENYNEAGNSAGLVAIRKHAMAATYPTPSAIGFEARDPERLLLRRQECKERTNNGNGFGLTLGQFATLENTNGSSEPTEKRGALNPEFVCWLMGFPTGWLSCAPSETRSTRARRPRS